MPIEFVQAVAAIFAVLFIAGCSTTSPHAGLGEPPMGEATRQTLAAQIIDPAPQYDYADPLTSGAHAADAIERYRSDKVKQPERVRTSNGGGGSGSSGG